MVGLFKILLEISLMAGIMVGIVLIIRRAFAKIMNPRIMIALWALILIRLLLPITLESPISLADLNVSNNLPAVTSASSLDHLGQTVAPGTEITSADTTQPIIQDQVNHLAAQPVGEAIVATVDQSHTTLSKFLSQLDIWSLIIGIWMAGAVITMLVSLKKYHLIKSKLQVCKSVDDSRVLGVVEKFRSELGIKKELQILLCDFAYAPSVFGFFEPKLLIPRQFIQKMDSDTLDLILLHEMQHIRYHDIFKNGLWLIAIIFHWFNPLVWIAYSQYEDEVELCRDQQVVRLLNEDAADRYSQSLLDAMKLTKRDGVIVSPLAASIIRSGSKLKERVTRLVNPRRHSKSAIAITVVLSVAMLASSFTTACQTTRDQVLDVVELTEALTVDIPATYIEVIRLDDGQTELSINAAVQAEDNTQIAEYSHQAMNLTDKKAAQIMNALFGNRTLCQKVSYLGNVSVGKDFLDYVMPLFEDNLNSADSDRARQDIRERISWYESLYPDAPDSIFDHPALTTFSPISAQEGLMYLETEWAEGLLTDESEYLRLKAGYEDAIYHGQAINLSIEGIVDLGYGLVGCLSIRKTMDYSNDSIYYKVMPFESYVTEMEFGGSVPQYPDLDISEDEAKQIADEMLDGLGITYMRLSGISQGTSSQTGHYYSFVYSPDIESVLSSGEYVLSDDSDTVPLISPGIRIHVNGDGVSLVDWDTPYDLIKLSSDQVRLMAFEDIMTSFSSQIFENLTYHEPDSESVIKRQFVVESIDLSAKAELQKAGLGHYIVTPVWNYEGYCILTYSDGYNRNVIEKSGKSLDENNQLIVPCEFMTINAIDGSVIDQ